MPDLMITLDAVCEDCQAEGVKGKAIDDIFFDDLKYEIIRDCLVCPEHDATEIFNWEDKEGPYCGRYKEFLGLAKNTKNTI